MGGKTELTTIKTLMEITGQNKEDVQSVLQKFGGDEALAVSELMCSTCNHHLSYLIFHVLAGKSSFFCEALCSSTRAKTDPLRLFFPKLQCISSWTWKRRRVKRYAVTLFSCESARAAIDSEIFFSLFFFTRRQAAVIRSCVRKGSLFFPRASLSRV